MVIRKSLRVPRDWVTSAQNWCVVRSFSQSHCRPNFLGIGNYCRGVLRDYRAVHRFTQDRRAILSLSTEWQEASYCSGNHDLPVRVFQWRPDQFAFLVASKSRLIAGWLFSVGLPRRGNIPIASDNYRRIEWENSASNLRNYSVQLRRVQRLIENEWDCSPYEACKAVVS